MNKVLRETEIIVCSSYCEYLIKILANCNKISIFKSILIAYLIKKDNLSYSSLYSTKNSKDITLKAISTLKGDFNDFCENTPYIVKSIDILIGAGIIKLDENMLSLTSNINEKETILAPFIIKVMDDFKKYTDKQLVEEVIINV